MMPKLPPPYGVLHGVQVWHGDDLLAYGHAVAEAKDAEIAELRAERERDDVAFELLVKEASLLRAERDALRALLMRAKDVLNDVAYHDGDLCVNADAEEMASSIDAALRGADKLAEGRDEN